MTELSALNIKITGDAGDLKAAVAAANGDLAKLAAGAEAAGLKVSGLGNKFNQVGGSASGIAPNLRNVSMQLSQVGQQAMVTGNFAQALAIQLPDIGIMFGAVGAAAGLLAGIALPILVSAFSTTSEKALALASAMKELASATEAFRIASAAIKMGIDQEEVLIVQQLNDLLRQRKALEEHIAQGIKNAKDTSQLQLNTINATIAPLEAQLKAYRQARTELDLAKAKLNAVKQNVGEIYDAIVQAKDAIVSLVASAPNSGWLSGAIGDAVSLASTLWDAAAAVAAVGTPGLAPETSMRPRRAPPGAGGVDWGGPDNAGGGGGATVNPLIAEIEALQSSLATQEQAQIDSFARQQETLTAALDQRLITQQEYAALMEAAQQQHSETMEGIDVWRYGTGLQKAGAFLGEMANVFAAGNDKMLKISRIAGAAQGLIDAYGAYLKALNAPGGMTPLQRLAMAGGVLAAGLKAVSSIKGGGGGGGGVSTAVAAASSAPAEMRTANINFYGGFQPTQDTIKMIAGGLNDWLGDGGRLNVGAS